MKKYLLIAILTLTIALGLSIKIIIDTRKDRDRLKANQTALLDKARYYRTRDSLSVASVQRITLTLQELKEERADLIKDLKRLQIKPNRVQSISTTAIETNTQIVAPVMTHTIQDQGGATTKTMECFEYQDQWQTIKGCVQDGDFRGTTHSVDSIFQTIYRVPRRFLFIKYGTKSIRQEVMNKKPNSSIFFTEYLEIKK